MILVSSRVPPLDRFGEARLKIERAQGQFAALRDAVKSWAQLGKAYEIVPEIDFKTREKVLRFIILSDPPPTWGMDAADIANNLRAALNYAIHAVAEPDSDDIGFPIYRVETEYRSPRPRAKKPRERLSPLDYYLAGVDERYRTFVDRCQPYRRGDAADSHPLAKLAVLSNTDKHRRALVTLAVPEVINAEVIPLGPVDLLKVAFLRPGRPLYHRAELARITVRPVNREVAVQGRMAVDVTFSQRHIAAPEIGRIGSYVVKVVDGLAAIQTEAAA
ncbi:MAG TPA: hypothetical protein VMP67_06560 [Candidatus Limnocylindria bacterium]|nr:hypothetical protein [Candidatus Limnocylindria bacterium]